MKSSLWTLFTSVSLAVLSHSSSWSLELEDIEPSKSLLITDRRVLDRLNDEFDLGYLLGDFGRDASERHKAILPHWRSKWTVGKFVEQIFVHTADEQRRHNALPLQQKLGGNYWARMYMDAVFRNWKSPEELSALTDLSQLKGGPFRLLAVVNRMDTATDFDEVTTEAARDPRALGEVHLIYGLVDKSYETQNQRAFPSIFSISYRLPPLKWGPTSLIVNPDISHRDLMANPLSWRWNMRFWSKLWGDLSMTGDVSSDNGAGLARKIGALLRLAVVPSNFIHLRNNTRINASEHELREWYMLQSNQTLIHRKPRNEPYRCLSGTSDLTEVVNYHWSSTDNDIDVRSRHPSYRLGLNANGYRIPRDNADPLISNILSDARRQHYSGCGSSETARPFMMTGSIGQVIRDERLLFVAPFGRTRPNMVWELKPGTDESKRHAFAIRTCTGCHSSEGASTGFHITPRLAKSDSGLSPFLIGGPAAKFTRTLGSPITYHYDELTHRKKLLHGFFRMEIKMFESLLRPPGG